MIALRFFFTGKGRNVYLSLVVGKIPALIGSPHIYRSRFKGGPQYWKIGCSQHVNILEVPYCFERIGKINSVLFKDKCSKRKRRLLLASSRIPFKSDYGIVTSFMVNRLIDGNLQYTVLYLLDGLSHFVDPVRRLYRLDQG